ncbi:hypothetical protein [Fimbriimonas ginsengisoli]|uniref:Uncharacterized protein n=1 Tax=Fimbriimonas ginsengisoli Gsoil 348 TaxID=661478 RepID=A0A068NJM1_FIMGI|nr:hypothetical protein [Fimbriimonas ginsengisoli]AIE83701.1 hypothetical protein OP10G_0333 [Fimbriimonas ginsengisoli Gsoil 348]
MSPDLPNLIVAAKSPKEHFAAILPLHYDDPNHPTDRERSRLENSVILLCSKWEDLVELLNDPVQYFKDKQTEWSQALPYGKARYEFNLKAPVTALIQPGKVEPRKRAQFNTFLAQKAALDSGMEFLDFVDHPDSAAALTRAQSQFETIGGFIAEFALGTSVLIIHYWPPKNPGEPRLKDCFTRATVGMMPGPKGVSPDDPDASGTLHIDIEHKKCDIARDTANLIVDMLESRESLLAFLNTEDNVESGVVNMEPLGSTIRIPDHGEPVGLPASGGDPVFAIDTTVPFTIYVEELSAEKRGCTCCNHFVVQKDGRFFLSHATLKGYPLCNCAQTGTNA